MPTKIVFWQTVADSFNFVFSDWSRFYRLAAVWIGLGMLVCVVVLLAFGASPFEQTPPAQVMNLDRGRVVAALLFFVLAVVTYVAFSVAWHRTVLLRETVAAPLGVLRFEGREVRFLLYLIVVGLLWIGVFLGLALVAGLAVGGLYLGQKVWGSFEPGGGAVAIALFVLFLFVIVMAPFLARFSLGLPAIAVEEPAGVFGRSWHRGWHNGWRLVWGPLICALPLSIVTGITNTAERVLAIYAPDFGGVWHGVGYLAIVIFYGIGATAHFLALATAVTFLSLSYRQLTRRETSAGNGDGGPPAAIP